MVAPNGYNTEDPYIVFTNLANKWREDTRFFSSVYQITDNPSYQAIMNMGEPFLPYIFNHMKKHEEIHWVTALNKITGIDAAKGLGSAEKARGIWLQWAKENGYSIEPELIEMVKGKHFQKDLTTAEISLEVTNTDDRTKLDSLLTNSDIQHSVEDDTVKISGELGLLTMARAGAKFTSAGEILANHQLQPSLAA